MVPSKREATWRGSIIPSLDSTGTTPHLFYVADDAHTTSNPNHHFGTWFLAVPVLLLAYGLSIGPVAKIFGPSPSPALRAFYSPLGYLYYNVPVAKSFYDWYAKLWGIRL